MLCDAFCKDSTSFSRPCYLIDFIGTANTAQKFSKENEINVFIIKRCIET